MESQSHEENRSPSHEEIKHAKTMQFSSKTNLLSPQAYALYS